jgi:hypothetical protein
MESAGLTPYEWGRGQKVVLHVIRGPELTQPVNRQDWKEFWIGAGLYFVLSIIVIYLVGYVADRFFNHKPEAHEHEPSQVQTNHHTGH